MCIRDREETAMDTSSVTEKATDESKRDDSSETKEDSSKKISSESKEEIPGKEKTQADDGSKMMVSREKEWTDKSKMHEDRSEPARGHQQGRDNDAGESRHSRHDDDFP